MTPLSLSDILSAQAGPVLDELVLRHVMQQAGTARPPTTKSRTSFSPSTSILDAQLVLVKMRECGLCSTGIEYENGSWRWSFMAREIENTAGANGQTQAEAICKAALMSRLYTRAGRKTY